MTGRVQLVGPLPPLRTGIASYTHELIRAVGESWDLALLPEPGSAVPDDLGVELIDVRQGPSPDDPIIFQVGNSLSHPRAAEHALRMSGVLVLHDVVLSHSRLGYHLRRRWPRGFVKEMGRSYGADGEAAARRILRDPGSGELMRYPLVEAFLERARVVVVHNDRASEMVGSLRPGTRVVQVPHGIAIPDETDVRLARRLVDLQAEDFVVLSLTHVNRFKRLPQLLAAFREVVARVPSAVLVVAGNVEPDIDLHGEIAMLGLENQVQVRGYVGDEEARLLARAADVAVALRYPSTGETSGSLLRLLGAGLPVIVTEGTLGDQVPAGVAPQVPVGAVEVPMLAELLVRLHADPALRAHIGKRGREFVKEHHSMGAEVDGYRQALRLAYGVELPRPRSEHLHEPLPTSMERLVEGATPSSNSDLDRVVGTALAELGLHRHAPVIRTAAERMVELDLDVLPRSEQARTDR